MSPDTFTNLWRAGGASVRGANHARASLPNQDALRWLPLPGALICVVSDGHGSAKSFRSDLGALFAVQTALRLIPETLKESPPANPMALAEQLPRMIVDAWRRAVEEHLTEAPFTDAEWARLSETGCDGARPACACSQDLRTAVPATGSREPAVEANSWLAYGATFLLCVVTPGFILYAQLGDGDILLVSQAGAVTRPNWQADPRLFANETTSLCMPEAWAEMRVDMQPIAVPDGRDASSVPHRRARVWRTRADCEPADDVQADPSSPALILLATDGYANSFVDDCSFIRVGSDLLAMVRADGFEAVCSGLPTWLEETSRLGSGDDITVGLVYRMPAGETPSPLCPGSASGARAELAPRVRVGGEAAGLSPSGPKGIVSRTAVRESGKLAPAGALATAVADRPEPAGDLASL